MVSEQQYGLTLGTGFGLEIGIGFWRKLCIGTSRAAYELKDIKHGPVRILAPDSISLLIGKGN